MATKQPSTLSEALAIFQSQVKAADKNGKAKFPQPRTYSLLEDVLKALQPATELGISHTQTFDYLPLENGKTLTVLITTLYFKNEKLESKLPLRELSGNNVYHDLGIAITYSRRYALAAAYGIGSEHDDDAVALTQPPAKEKGTDRTHTKAKQKLAPVSEQAKKNPPITTEARNLITDQLKQLMETNPDKAKEIAASFIKEFKVPRVTGFITEANEQISVKIGTETYLGCVPMMILLL